VKSEKRIVKSKARLQIFALSPLALSPLIPLNPIKFILAETGIGIFSLWILSLLLYNPKQANTCLLQSGPNIKTMTTIVITPKSKAEKDFLTRLLKKMNVESRVVEDPLPNYETRKALADVDRKKGTRVKNTDELFAKLGI
jgi:hypothetical protein